MGEVLCHLVSVVVGQLWQWHGVVVGLCFRVQKQYAGLHAGRGSRWYVTHWLAVLRVGRLWALGSSHSSFGHPGGGGVFGLEGGWRGGIAVWVFHVQGVPYRGGKACQFAQIVGPVGPIWRCIRHCRCDDNMGLVV